MTSHPGSAKVEASQHPNCRIWKAQSHVSNDKLPIYMNEYLPNCLPIQNLTNTQFRKCSLFKAFFLQKNPIKDLSQNHNFIESEWTLRNHQICSIPLGRAAHKSCQKQKTKQILKTSFLSFSSSFQTRFDQAALPLSLHNQHIF